MGQNEIGKVLKRNYPNYLSVKEIAEQTGVSKMSASTALKSMKKRYEVEYKVIPGSKLRSGWMTVYRIKGGK